MHLPTLTALADRLEQAGKALASNADEQELASAASSRACDLRSAGRAAGLAGRISLQSPTSVAAATAPPTAGTSPKDVHAWWEGLTEDQRRQAILAHEDTLANQDGIPGSVRNQLNRARLERAQAELVQRVVSS